MTIAHISHNRPWSPFFEPVYFLAYRERKLLAHFDLFRLFCREFTHVLVYFLRA